MALGPYGVEYEALKLTDPISAVIFICLAFLIILLLAAGVIFLRQSRTLTTFGLTMIAPIGLSVISNLLNVIREYSNLFSQSIFGWVSDFSLLTTIMLVAYNQLEFLNSITTGKFQGNSIIVWRLKIGLLALYVLMVLPGVFGILPTLGSFPANWVKLIYRFGANGFIFICILYNSFHTVYILRYLTGLTTQQVSKQSSQVQNGELTEENAAIYSDSKHAVILRMAILVVGCFFLDWIGVAVLLASGNMTGLAYLYSYTSFPILVGVHVLLLSIMISLVRTLLSITLKTVLTKEHKKTPAKIALGSKLHVKSRLVVMLPDTRIVSNGPQVSEVSEIE